MQIIDLFAGIGGFSLAGHWMGWHTVAFCEIEDYPRKVLQKNFPGVYIHGDIRTLTRNILIENTNWNENKETILTGGFPCQPFSTAGKRNGTADDRYLWPEMLRVIREVQPTWVIGENVAGIVSMDDGRVLERILNDLESEGYSAQSFIIPSASIGAPHRRDRIWIIARNISQRGREENHRGKPLLERGRLLSQKGREENTELSPDHHRELIEANSHLRHDEPPKRQKPEKRKQHPRRRQPFGEPSPPNREPAAYPSIKDDGRYIREPEKRPKPQLRNGTEQAYGPNVHWFEVATRLCRVDDGLPSWMVGHRTQRLKALGNAVDPRVVYELFRAIQQQTT